MQIYAVIYIYNPPDRAKLGIPEEKNPAGAAPACRIAAGQCPSRRRRPTRLQGSEL